MKKNPFRLLFQAGFLILLGGCSVSNRSTKEAMLDSGILNINADSTFNYEHRFEFTYSNSSGRWRKSKKNSFKLRSDVQSKILDLKSKRSSVVNGIRVNIKSDIQSSKLSYYRLLVFDKNKLILNTECGESVQIDQIKEYSELHFGLVASDRIPSRALDTLLTKVYSPIEGILKDNEFDISLNSELFNYRVFDDFEIKIPSRNLNSFPIKVFIKHPK